MAREIDIELRAVGPGLVDLEVESTTEDVDLEVRSAGSGGGGGGGGLPPGGVPGDILVKTSPANYAAAWVPIEQVAPEEVFWATYEETPSADIAAAVAAEKVILLKNGNLIFRLVRVSGDDESARYTFVCPIGQEVRRILLTAQDETDTWSLEETFVIPEGATLTPRDLAEVASVGSSARYAREDHAHKLPSAADIGAYVKPAGGIPASDLAEGAGLPSGGQIGDIVMKTNGGGAWITPANSVEEDNTRPITSAAVYVEVGNINALLATI